jgi:hypothetical protein
MSPHDAGNRFSGIINTFLGNLDDFKPKSKSNHSNSFIRHDPSALSRSKSWKNSLRKSAFGPNSTLDQRREFYKAVRIHNQIQKEIKKQRKHANSHYQEKFWEKEKVPSFNKDFADNYYPLTYSNEARINVEAVSSFPWLNVPPADAENGLLPFDMSPILPKHIRLILNKKVLRHPRAPTA